MIYFANENFMMLKLSMFFLRFAQCFQSQFTVFTNSCMSWNSTNSFKFYHFRVMGSPMMNGRSMSTSSQHRGMSSRQIHMHNNYPTSHTMQVSDIRI